MKHRDIKNVAQNRHLLANVIHPARTRTVVGVGATNGTDHIKVYFLQLHEPVLSQDLRKLVPLNDCTIINHFEVNRFQVEGSNSR